MVTAVDVDVLLDVLLPSSPEASASEARLATALSEGALVVCPTVAAELAAQFTRDIELRLFLRDTGLRVDPFGLQALQLAGHAWRTYRRRREPAACASCGAPLPRLPHVASEFLVGGHASAQADRLLTRDRDFYRSTFPKLKLA